MPQQVTLQIGLVVFPGLTQLDLTGPFEVLSRLSNSRIHLLWKRLEPVLSDRGLTLFPTSTFALSSQMDVILVPGGPGILALMEDGEVLTFLRRQAQGGRYVASVCTGALVLGAAGLLQGYRATTHWTSLEFLSAFGATPCADRIVIDRNRLTGGGVTLALTLRCNSPLSYAEKKRRASFNSKWNTTRRRRSNQATPTSRMPVRYSSLWMQTHSSDRPAVKLSNGSRRDCATPDDR